MANMHLSSVLTALALLVNTCDGVELRYATSPADNPLKGLVPYVDADGRDQFPNSLEFRYFAFSDLMKGNDQIKRFDWSVIEKTLGMTSGRGNQLVIRIYLEMPGEKTGVPRFLIDQGLKVTRWKSDDGLNHTPDYENKSLRRAINEFITAFGKRYDGDPRIGYVTAGILGMWGEWHDYPRENLFASKTVQVEVLDAYSKSFRKTPVLHRYPSGANDQQFAANDTLPMGYHDDSFAWATLNTGRGADSWFYMSLLKKAGPGAMQKWMTHPIGGEIRPELWKTLFTEKPHRKQQDFSQCVQQTHVTWLMDSGLFNRRRPPNADRIALAKHEVSKMGYELHVAKAEFVADHIVFTVENRGVAPFYHDWAIELSCITPTNGIERITTDWKLSEIMPGEQVQWRKKLKPRDDLILHLRVIHPMKGGKPFRFANEEMQGDALVVKF